MSNESVITDLDIMQDKFSLITPRTDIDLVHQFRIYHDTMRIWIQDVTRDEFIQNPDMRVDVSGVIPDTVPSEALQKISRTLPVVYATPDRAFAQVFNLINAIRMDLGLSPLPEDSQRRYFALPMVSYAMSSLDARREWFSLGMTTFANLSDKDALVYLYPAPYNITYTVTIWSRTHEVLYRLIERFILQFRHNTMYFEVDFKSLHEKLGKKLISIEMTGSAERSELEPGEKRDRVLRYDIDIRVYGYLFLQGFIGKRALRAQPNVEAVS